MNIEKARAKMKAYFAANNPAQIVKNLEALGCKFEPLQEDYTTFCTRNETIEYTSSVPAKIIKFTEKETQTLTCDDAATNNTNLFVTSSFSFISAA